LQLWGEEIFIQGLGGGNPRGKKPIGRHRRRWENNIKMDFKEVGLGACTGLFGHRIGTGGRLV
jgi:hypothetical protein